MTELIFCVMLVLIVIAIMLLLVAKHAMEVSTKYFCEHHNGQDKITTSVATIAQNANDIFDQVSNLADSNTRYAISLEAQVAVLKTEIEIRNTEVAYLKDIGTAREEALASAKQALLKEREKNSDVAKNTQVSAVDATIEKDPMRIIEGTLDAIGTPRNLYEAGVYNGLVAFGKAMGYNVTAVDPKAYPQPQKLVRDSLGRFIGGDK